MHTEKIIKKHCYCDVVDARFRKKNDIPNGYCGICEVCGKPGHTQHFPGAVPYTGAWCDNCLKRVARHHQIKTTIVVLICLSIILLMIGGIIFGIMQMIL